jgi:hypothetical protein
MSESLSSPWTKFSRDLRDATRKLVEANPVDQMSPDRQIVWVLQFAMFDAVRDEWENTAKAAGLEMELIAARKLMAREGYGPEMFPLEPICGMPGVPAFVCKIDGKDAVCFDASMAGMMPLSAYYTNKVREMIDMAAEVGELIEAAQREREHASQVVPGGNSPLSPNPPPVDPAAATG